MTGRSFLRMLRSLLVSASGPPRAPARRFRPQCDPLEGRTVLDATFHFARHDVVIVSDALQSAAPVDVRLNGESVCVPGDRVDLYARNPANPRDVRVVLAVDTNGVTRPRHPDFSAPPGTEDLPGTSVPLPPGLYLEGNQDFLGA